MFTPEGIQALHYQALNYTPVPFDLLGQQSQFAYKRLAASLNEQVKQVIEHVQALSQALETIDIEEIEAKELVKEMAQFIDQFTIKVGAESPEGQAWQANQTDLLERAKKLIDLPAPMVCKAEIHEQGVNPVGHTVHLHLVPPDDGDDNGRCEVVYMDLCGHDEVTFHCGSVKGAQKLFDGLKEVTFMEAD